MNEIAELTEENYECRRVSNFLDWAHRRLSEEMEQIREMEAEHGTAEWNKGDTHYRNASTARSYKEKRRIVKEVDDLRRDGCNVATAAKLCGICATSYAMYRKQCGLGKFKKGVKGTRPIRKKRDAGSTPATSTINQ